MKIFCVVLFILAASLSKVSALTKDESAILLKALTPTINECGKEFSLSLADVQKATKSYNAAAFVPCFVACTMKKLSFLNKDAQYTPQKGMSEVKKLVGNKVDLTAHEDVANKCLKVNDQAVSDANADCDRAKLVVICAIENKIVFPF